MKAAKKDDGEHLARVRRICAALPGTTEKPSHGEPTFFAGRSYATFSNNHHSDGHIAVCVAAAGGVQEALIASNPKAYYRPPYVGVRGWVGIELAEVDDEALGAHLLDAWRLIAPKKFQKY